MKQRGYSPYDCFKSDRYRLRALISRDIRLVLVAIALALANSVPELQALVSSWLP